MTGFVLLVIRWGRDGISFDCFYSLGFSNLSKKPIVNSLKEFKKQNNWTMSPKLISPVL